MTQAFKRIPASNLEAFLEGADDLTISEVLEDALKRAREEGGEVVIEAFIVDDSKDDEEEEDAA